MPNIKTSQETTRTPIDGTEFVRLATSGENWKSTIADLFAALIKNVYSNAQVGTTYTLLSSDNGKVITFSNANPITLTCPTGLGIGFSCMIIQLGVGAVSVVTDGGTLNSFLGLTSLSGQYAMGTIIAPTADNFILGGQLS